MTEEFRREPSNTEATVAGKIVRRLVLPDSRAEVELPVLLSDDGRLVRVHVRDDDPFAEETLSALLDRKVLVRGTWRNGVLRAARDDLQILESP